MTDFGLRVTYDLVYHITVTLPGNYRGRTCGLCGNFNSNKSDEFQLPGGSMTKDSQAFGAAWKVPVPGVVCEDGCMGDLCPKCNDSVKAAVEEKCAIITNPNGPFAGCHDVIDPSPYFTNCVYDVCMANDEKTMMCHSVAAYMLDCQDFGAPIKNWRTPSFCRESTHFYHLLSYPSPTPHLLHICIHLQQLLAPIICLQLLHAVPTAIMKCVRCLVPLHVLVSVTLPHAPRIVLRAAPVMITFSTMEPAVCPLTSAAAITKAKLTR